jgi:hypothetical protein
MSTISYMEEPNAISNEWVRAPGGKRRLARPSDTVLRINEDGTVTIPDDVEVYETGPWLAFRTDRLLGWADLGSNSPIVFDGGRRRVRDAVIEELARQGRGLLPLPDAASRRAHDVR